MYKLSVQHGKDKIIYKPLSAVVKFLIDNKNITKDLAGIEKAFNINLTSLQKKNFLSTEPVDIKFYNYKTKPDLIILHKVKNNETLSTDYFRNTIAGFIQSLFNEEISNLHIQLPQYDNFKKIFDDEEYFYQTFIEGVFYGNYVFDRYKEDKKEKELSVFFYGENSKKIVKSVQKAKLIMEGVYFTRNLQNEPGNILPPARLAERIKSSLTKTGVKVKIFDEKEIKKMKMGGLLSIGIGSENPPRFIVAEYKPKIKAKKKIVLVGKGITFDTGGISIKPASGMWEMKGDMSGAAVVAGTILAAAKLQLPIEITGIIPAAENMLSGKAVRPGDIVKTASGKTIEVDNTDAEGRVVLADALHYASKLKPDAIIDLATLTGACVVALGEYAAGLFTKNDKLADDLFKSGLKTFDRVWQLPLWDDYNQLIKSDVADVKNIGGRWGGAITAAKFLEKFVDRNIPWVHIDIAGPAMAHNLNNYTKTYMTGFGVRLLIDFLKK